MIANPFQMNDWEIKKFLKVILTLQVAMFGVIGLDAIGLQIPILRQLIGFIYLTFIPGILILRILKLHKLGNIETLLYTVGLSIATLMFTGLFMNTVYPLFGISGPISLVPLIFTISVVVLVLCVLCYIRDKDVSDPSCINVGDILSPPALFLCLIPFLAILGTYLINFYQNSIVLMFLAIIIAIIPILIAFDKFIPKNLYPLAVFIIAISLLYHHSLISMYLSGYDIHIEYYLSNLVQGNSHWDSTRPYTVNAMLSIVMLAPIYSIVSNMDIIWVFKIIYPLLFSLLPLGLYRIYQKQTNDKIAFLSCFFFVSLFIFYSEMLSLARQEIAELFLVLLILLMVNTSMNKQKRSFLVIVFGISLVVSHYGLSYIYMFYLIAVGIILVLMDNPAIQELKDDFHSKFSRYKYEKHQGNLSPLKTEDRMIHPTFVLLFVIFTLTWYMYVSRAVTFNTAVQIGNHISSSLVIDFVNPGTRSAIGYVSGTLPPLHNITKILHLITQFFIIIGIIKLTLKPKEMNFFDEYRLLSILGFATLVACFAIPLFSSQLNTSRMYHITLIFLAPFCILGGEIAFKLASKALNFFSHRHINFRGAIIKLMCLFLTIYFLFNVGFIYGIAREEPLTMSVCAEDKPYHMTYTEQEVVGIKWLSNNKDEKNRKVFTESLFGNALGESVFGYHYAFTSDTYQLPGHAYVFLGRRCVKYDEIKSPKRTIYDIEGSSFHNSTFYNTVVSYKNKIYSDENSQIYY